MTKETTSLNSNYALRHTNLTMIIYIYRTSGLFILKSVQDTYFWNSHSLLSSGHTWRVLSQREMQWKWKACWKTKFRSHNFRMYERISTGKLPLRASKKRIARVCRQRWGQLISQSADKHLGIDPHFQRGGNISETAAGSLFHSACSGNWLTSDEGGSAEFSSC